MPLLSTYGGASAYGFRPRNIAVAAEFIEATGGTITTSGDYTYHTFTGAGTFTVTSAPSGKYVDVLLVGAGGHGLFNNVASGGGGGVVVKTGRAVSLGSYSIVIGTSGSETNTTAFGETAINGGSGGNAPSSNGGSGGGSSTLGLGGAALQPTSQSGGYGNAGNGGDGGGGGAGGAPSGANGGVGITPTPFTGTYGAGGSYGVLTTSVNSGDGGGANSIDGELAPGAAGVVIVRYLFQ